MNWFLKPVSFELPIAMTDLYSFLARGYFPPKLPAPFSTQRLAQVLSAQSVDLPSSFTNGRTKAKLAHHSVARTGIRRRRISFPNPVTQYRLFKVIAENWLELSSFAMRGNVSLSKPKGGQSTSRAIVMEYGFDDLPRRRMRLRATSRYILKADIARCYPSIYSHCLPWALHGKNFAKSNRGNEHLGNLLDKCVRQGQDDETVGLPIGPDSSYLLAEVILNTIDEQLLRALGNINGIRYSDDYEFGFRTEAEAQSGLSTLESLLGDYHLHINQQKTKITPLPMPADSIWVPKLRNFGFRTSRRGQATDLATYFDLAFQLYREYPEDHVLNYAVARLSPRTDPSEAIHKDNWALLQDFLFQCLMVETGTFLKVIELLIQYHKLGSDIDVASIDDMLNALVPEQCALDRGSELAWSVWSMIFFGIKIRPAAAKALSSVRDNIVALLALDANARHLIPSGLDTSAWLLAYEANVKGWLPQSGKKDLVTQDPCFGYLKNQGVQFYEATKLPLAVPAGATFDDELIAPLFEDYFY